MTAHKTIKFDFNPRFPRGKRQRGRRSGAGGPEFQSTLPAREATPGKRRLTNPGKYFNPRFPRGKRPLSGRSLSFLKIFQSTLPAGEATSSSRFCSSDLKISIHASREGSDQSAPHCTSSARNFNPRFPRGKRRREIIIMARNLISIHASREGSDLFILISPFYFFNFNPRFPRGKRLNVHSLLCTLGIFQSTLPAGEATIFKRFDFLFQCISIHASRGGSDCRLNRSVCPTCYFNPRFPRGKRPVIYWILPVSWKFQSTLPAGEATESSPHIPQLWAFQSTLPAGEATVAAVEPAPPAAPFQSTLPAGEATCVFYFI